MRRNALIFFGIGLAMLIAGVLKVLPGGVTTGATLAFGGALLFGLSFIPRPEMSAVAPPPLSPGERIAAMFYEPSRVFQNLRRQPRVFVPLLVMALVTITYNTAFIQRMTPERIAGHMTEKLTESGWVPAEQAQKAREDQIADAKSVPTRVGAAISQVVWLFVLMAFIAALYLLGVLVFGGQINFWQALSIALHAALPVTILQKLLSLLLLYLKSPDDIHPILGQQSLVQDNLGVLFSPAAHPVLFVAASFIGVLSFYGLWLTATGLRHGGERVTSSAAWGTALLVFMIGFLFAVGSTALFPGFIS